jgi:hypothetical protein
MLRSIAGLCFPMFPTNYVPSKRRKPLAAARPRRPEFSTIPCHTNVQQKSSHPRFPADGNYWETTLYKESFTPFGSSYYYGKDAY